MIVHGRRMQGGDRAIKKFGGRVGGEIGSRFG